MLRFLLIFIGVLLLINIIGRILFHWMIRRLVRKSHENIMKQQSRVDKDTTLTINKKSKSKNSGQVGEYVDFEEIP